MFPQSAAADNHFYQNVGAADLPEAYYEERNSTYKLAALRQAVMCSEEVNNYYQHSQHQVYPASLHYTPTAAQYEPMACSKYFTPPQTRENMPAHSSSVVSASQCQQQTNHDENQKQELKYSCELINGELWAKFNIHTTEMIITKQGRRMFPTLQIRIRGLNPYLYYTVIVEVALSNTTQWKYQGGKWIPSGQLDGQASPVSSYYVHPDSPNSGAHWMKQDLTFAKMKLTNNKKPGTEQIILNSMHKYQPKIIVREENGGQAAHVFTLPNTEFVAVTAYQNTNITQLKIDHNPFAKGFRDSYDRLTQHVTQSNLIVSNTTYYRNGISDRQPWRSSTQPQRLHRHKSAAAELYRSTDELVTQIKPNSNQNYNQVFPRSQINSVEQHVTPFTSDYFPCYQSYERQDEEQQSPYFSSSTKTTKQAMPMSHQSSQNERKSRNWQRNLARQSSPKRIEQQPSKKKTYWVCQQSSLDLTEKRDKPIQHYQNGSQLLVANHTDPTQDSVTCR